MYAININSTTEIKNLLDYYLPSNINEITFVLEQPLNGEEFDNIMSIQNSLYKIISIQTTEKQTLIVAQKK